jgi:integrase
MASLEKRPHGFRVVFMFRGEKHARSLQTKDPKQAKSTLARMEDTLRRIELGTLQVPDGADIATFLLSDGNLAAKPRNEKPTTLTQIFDEYFANLPAGANEATTIDGMRLHQRHLERLLGAEFHVQRLTVSDLQGFIEKRSKEKGIRGNVTATTIKKALVTFRTIWRWGMMTDRLTGSFPNRGLRYPKASEKPPFQTWAEISRQIQRGGLSDSEQSELWDCLYLTLPEVDELLQLVKRQALQPFIYPMFVFAAHTGARRSEIVRSRISDLDFEANMVTIRERKRVHSQTTTRRVPMTPLLAEVLKEWLKQHPGGAQTFCQPPGIIRSKTVRSEPTPVTRDEAHDHFKRTLKDGKWKVLRGWHIFRHSFISLLASKGVDQRLIDSFVGHTTEDMRRRYRHLYPSIQQSVMAAVFIGQ